MRLSKGAGVIVPDLMRLVDERSLDIEAPDGWRRVGDWRGVASVFVKIASRNNLSVLASEAETDDGSRWVHLSVSVKRGLPSWSAMVAVKMAFLPPESYAVQVFPPESCYVSVADCLHIWAGKGEQWHSV